MNNRKYFHIDNDQLIRMKINYFSVILIVLFIISACSEERGAKQKNLILWYKQPAQEWIEALPVGNGHLGAMVFGGVGTERIQPNEESLWVGFKG